MDACICILILILNSIMDEKVTLHSSYYLTLTLKGNTKFGSFYLLFFWFTLYLKLVPKNKDKFSE